MRLRDIKRGQTFRVGRLAADATFLMLEQGPEHFTLWSDGYATRKGRKVFNHDACAGVEVELVPLDGANFAAWVCYLKETADAA